MVNIFIAFMLPKEASSDMDKVAEDVKELFLPNGKDEKFFHCTILFIGRVAEEYIPFIQEKMKSIAAIQKPITININDIGYFFSTKKDRIKVVKTEDIHPPKTGVSVHFCVLSLMAMQK